MPLISPGVPPWVCQGGGEENLTIGHNDLSRSATGTKLGQMVDNNKPVLHMPLISPTLGVPPGSVRGGGGLSGEENLTIGHNDLSRSATGTKLGQMVDNNKPVLHMPFMTPGVPPGSVRGVGKKT